MGLRTQGTEGSNRKTESFKECKEWIAIEVTNGFLSVIALLLYMEPNSRFTQFTSKRIEGTSECIGCLAHF